MNKYSIKIYNFLDKHLKNIKPTKQDMTETNIYNQISELIKRTYSDINNYTYKISTIQIPKLHQPNTHPMLYTLFQILNKYDLIKDLDCDTSNFTNYINWHREFYCSLDIKNLQQLIIKSNIPELLTLYNIIYNPDKLRLNLHSLYTNPFVSLDILQFIETVDLIQTIYISDIYELTIYHQNNQNIQDIIDLNKILHILVCIYKLNKDNPDKLHNAKIIVSLILCNQKKYLPRIKQSILCSDNVNSGSTLSGSHITIWRQEEIYKVLIHELIHFYELDFNSNYNNLNNIIDLYCKKLYNISGKNHDNEAFTEIMANIINCCLVSYYTKKDVNKIFNIEVLFSLFQAYKLFTYFGYDTRNIDWHIQFKQNTSVFSYYIIKCALLYNISDFIKLFEDSIYFTRQTNKPSDIIEKELIILIKSSMDKLKDLIILNHKQLQHSIETSNGFICNTMRMTCFG